MIITKINMKKQPLFSDRELILTAIMCFGLACLLNCTKRIWKHLVWPQRQPGREGTGGPAPGPAGARCSPARRSHLGVGVHAIDEIVHLRGSPSSCSSRRLGSANRIRTVMKRVTPSKSTARRKLLFTEDRARGSLRPPGTGPGYWAGTSLWHSWSPRGRPQGSSTRRGRRLSLFLASEPCLGPAAPSMDVAGLGRRSGLRPPTTGLGW